MNKIALVDDDQNILTSLSMALAAEGFDIATYSDGESALDGLLQNPPELVVLDVKMPRMDGLEVLTKLREKSHVPVIFLTSVDDEVDQVVGLRMGADDYITKPFSQRLLIERIRVLLRRQALQSKTDDQNIQNTDEKLVYGDLELDDARHQCTWKEKPVNLTVTEYLLLKSLVERPGHVKNRDQLIDHAYGENIYVDDRTIDSHIKRVRKKFRKTDQEFNKIETIYGIGYKYRED